MHYQPGRSFSWTLFLHLFWTKLLGRIHHNSWRHVETLGLGCKLLTFLQIHLPSSAEQVQTHGSLRALVEDHGDAVCTGASEEAHADVVFCEAEAAAFHCDVGLHVFTSVTEAVAAFQEHLRAVGVIVKADSDAVSTLEFLSL